MPAPTTAWIPATAYLPLTHVDPAPAPPPIDNVGPQVSLVVWWELTPRLLSFYYGIDIVLGEYEL